MKKARLLWFKLACGYMVRARRDSRSHEWHLLIVDHNGYEVAMFSIDLDWKNLKSIRKMLSMLSLHTPKVRLPK
jgi:hypothetical protein